MPPQDTSGATLAQVGEFGAIARWAHLLSSAKASCASVRLGIGDDGALLDSLSAPVVTWDALVEGVHFKLDWTSPLDLGWKTLAASLSDLAAMGARPAAAFLSLAAPPTITLPWLDEFYRGLGECAAAFGCPIAGGDTTRSPGPLFLSLCAAGQVLEQPLRRDGARAGDVLLVTGTLGDSRGGLRLLQEALPNADASSAFLLARHHRPTPRLREIAGVVAGVPGAVTAALDLSDGLAGDAAHIAGASGVSLRIEKSRLPLSPALQAVASRHNWDAGDEALRGGEDYELLLCVRPDLASSVQAAIEQCGTQATIIGRVEEGTVAVVIESDGSTAAAEGSWTHF